MHKFWITLSKRFAKQRWLSIGNGQENPRRASRLTASLLPILQSIDADAHKLCKCTLTYTKLLSQKLHILLGLHSTTSFNRPHARRPLGATQNLSSILHAFKKLSKIFLIHVCMPPQSCQLPFSVLRSSSLLRPVNTLVSRKIMHILYAIGVYSVKCTMHRRVDVSPSPS